MSINERLKKYSYQDLIRELRNRKVQSIGIERTTAPNAELEEFDDATLYEYARAAQEVIYEVDDRKDIYSVEDPKVQEDADSVVSLFWAVDVIDNGDGSSTLNTKSFKNEYELCDHEPFAHQPIGPFCSGFLVAENIIATAGHCIKESDLSEVLWVFGFRMVSENTALITISNDQIYRSKKLLGRELTNDGTDWALVELDRPVLDHKIVSIREEGMLDSTSKLHVIGHPCGLPLKYADGASVRENSAQTHFTTNLDTYGGNSGSPVFNSETHIVEGILVRGHTDFAPIGDCMVSLVCPDNGDNCRGEDCTRSSEFTSYLR